MFNLGATLTGINTLSKAGEYVAPVDPYDIEEISDLFANSKGIWINPNNPTKMRLNQDGTGSVTATDTEVQYIEDSSGTGNHIQLGTGGNDPVGMFYGRHPASGYNQLLRDSNDLTQGTALFGTTTVCAIDANETSPVSYADVFKVSRTDNSTSLSGWSLITKEFTTAQKTATLYFKPIIGAGLTTAGGLAVYLTDAYVVFMISGLTATASGTRSSEITNASITSLANGWYKLQFNSTIDGNNFLLIPYKADGSYGISGLDMQYHVSAPQYQFGTTASNFQVSVGQHNITEPNQDSLYYLHTNLNFDGLHTSQLADLGTTDEITIYVAILDSVDAETNILELSDDVATGVGNFRLWYENNSFKFTVNGTSVQTVAASRTITEPTVITAKAKISTDTATIKANTTFSSNSNDLGTGNFSYNTIHIGARDADSGEQSTKKLDFANIYQLVIVNRLTTAQEDTDVVAKLEDLMGV